MPWHPPPRGVYPATHAGMVRYVTDQMGMEYRDYQVTAEMFRHAVDFIRAAVMDQGQRVVFRGLGTFFRKDTSTRVAGPRWGIGFHPSELVNRAKREDEL